METMIDKLTSAILIVDDKLSPIARSGMDKIVSCKLQVWKESELVINPTLSIYTPLHVM